MGIIKKLNSLLPGGLKAYSIWLVVVVAVSVYLSKLMTRHADKRRISYLEVADFQRVIPTPSAIDLDSSQRVSLDADVSWVTDSTLPPESYRIEIYLDGFIIYHGERGQHRASATLKQLHLLYPDGASLPIGTVSDSPAFPHRGVLLDVGRHFFPPTAVKRQLDLMHLYKFNVLHLHLTEDQGWRLPIPAFPKLTQIGAFRTAPSTTSADSAYGGFYTKAQLKDLVSYADSLGITIIPEIELPGHSRAALAAYPELGCTGQSLPVPSRWGVFEDIYCAGNEQTFSFLEQVLDEVCDIFPSPYIHIGGDEAPKKRWEHCPKCQRRIKDEGLENEEALQRYFITRIENYLAEKGRKIIGWDEILEGGLSPNATVQSWRGFEGGYQSALAGHDAIMSPTSHAYFDAPLASIDVPKVYSYDPIPPRLPDSLHHHILGGECNLWTEYIPNSSSLDRHFLPRALPMTEVLWHYPKAKSVQSFRQKMQFHYPILEAMGHQYDLEEEVLAVSHKVNEDLGVEVEYELTAPGYGLDLKYNGPEGIASKEHNGPEGYKGPHGEKLVTQNLNGITSVILPIVKGQHHLSAQVVKNQKPVGAPKSLHFYIHDGIAHQRYYSPPSPKYTGGSPQPLSDARLGSTNFRDGAWAGYFNTELQVDYELPRGVRVDSIRVRCLQSLNSWIVVPPVIWLDFDEESDVILRYEFKRNLQPSHPLEQIETFVLAPETGQRFPEFRTFTIRIPKGETLPKSHPAAGQPSWLFVDEIQLFTDAD